MHGFWSYDWADSLERVTNIDTNSKTITLEDPGKVGPLRNNRRYFALNALSELDMPGEYYIDRNSGILYFWPGEPLTNQSSLVVSVTQGIIRSTVSFSNVVFEDITFEGNTNNINYSLPKSFEAWEWMSLKQPMFTSVIASFGILVLFGNQTNRKETVL